MRFFLVLLLILPGAGSALEYCDELWFTRNLVFHQAGHCFGSALGKAVFGNEGCNPAGASLSKEDLAFTNRVRAEEKFEGCKIDTKRTALPVILPEVRKSLIDIPFPSLYESGCIGWSGDPVTLHKAKDASSDVTNIVRKGDVLLFQFEDDDE